MEELERASITYNIKDIDRLIRSLRDYNLDVEKKGEYFDVSEGGKPLGQISRSSGVLHMFGLPNKLDGFTEQYRKRS